MSDRKRRRRKTRYIDYDYEAAYQQNIELWGEWFAEMITRQQGRHGYALKEIRAGDQLEVEMYPEFGKMSDVPAEGQRIVKDNSNTQRNLNDRNARKRLERLINANFGKGDLWITLTYSDDKAPPDGDIDAAIKIFRGFLRRVNYQRKKRGLPNAKYVYVTAYNPGMGIRWHHHMVMDGMLDWQIVNSCWKHGGRNDFQPAEPDEDGLSGLANYIALPKNRIPGERRWNSSKGNLKDPDIKKVHNKRSLGDRGLYRPVERYVKDMIRDHDKIEEFLKIWYPDYIFSRFSIRFNDVNKMFYITGRMHRKRGPDNGS